ncbi:MULTISPECIES: flagellar hook capping FlgD N-terminal domain-containing protein [Sulfurospirillum]|jgi:flagellar basal-body rod modification protein FlgD|uniref:Basal-body rod modification protein FlgD n=1 Tax=Sulfurospirillum cavolei TaxID=366522 RepID=A0A2D3WL02_9BACT|nr:MULTISPECIES: flagellar hook capping FlgD N-terminal domain-containing protein [Sulfurospirillum]MCP3652484.1 flagellar hook capping protein [Sulfurospirillum sp. DNRA8]MCR1811335.1 flagellar hook capping protein [Sulfurospirillum sp. DNRA8]MDY0264152.1 flagellar hook capping FlgD N-terminal domain-containing protein [Sulfurospirillum cavolei]DAB37223.1 MAG TPA: flagellar hook capping protein [Sulfurospirillum cavolei]
MATGYENLIKTGSSTTTSGTSSSTSTAKTGSADSLNKDDFLQLLLVELQHQDPTDPMDSDKILTQTSQLATLEASENTNKALEDLAAQLKQSVSAGATSVIGKMASLGYNAITLKDGEAAYEVYFPNEIKDGTLTIKDANKNTVQTIDLGDVAAGKSGVVAFKWDGTNQYGDKVKDGYYSVTADYVDANGKSQTTQFGVYPVESIRYEDGETYVKLGSTYYPMGDVTEFYEQSLIS